MSFWIKIENTTPEKPEMDGIAKVCNCSRSEAFLAFFRFYCWADSVSEDGYIAHLTADGADERARLAGFGKALEKVEWVFFDDRGATIAHFDRHNGQSAKKRALATERKRKSRVS